MQILLDNPKNNNQQIRSGQQFKPFRNIIKTSVDDISYQLQLKSFQSQIIDEGIKRIRIMNVFKIYQILKLIGLKDHLQKEMYQKILAEVEMRLNSVKILQNPNNPDNKFYDMIDKYMLISNKPKLNYATRNGMSIKNIEKSLIVISRLFSLISKVIKIPLYLIKQFISIQLQHDINDPSSY